MKPIQQFTPLEVLPYARLDPRRVRRGLSRATTVGTDDFLAKLESLQAERLAEILITPNRILELARRPGPFATLLQQHHPKANIVSMGLVPPMTKSRPFWQLPWRNHPLFLAGDPMHLPFPPDHFDVAILNMMLHWSVDPLVTLREIRRVVKPGGLLLLCTMGEGTLGELKKSLDEIDQKRYGRTWIRVREFLSLHRLGDLLASAGFMQSVADRDIIRLALPDTATLLKELRRMGSVNPHRQRSPGLMGKGYPALLETCYRQRFALEDGFIPVTMEILFGHAWKADPSQKKQPAHPETPNECMP